jgi:hypothetical protein
MIHGKVLWSPYPYRAGLCITDDTDAATFEQIKTVYDFLARRRFLTTKTVWPFLPSDKCGIPPTPDSTLRGVTLQHAPYLHYCRMLTSLGFEICLHGASAGNNLRESTIKAFDFLNREFGPSDTYICHSKNADNIYWNENVTSIAPFRRLLKLVSGFSCSGEIAESPYFWGDICHAEINQIRLYRTRCVNTLKSNPSMPYFSPDKPFVNGWFSATKRSLAYCAAQKSQERLTGENGLTVLYQYLHRYAGPDGKTLNPRFMESIESLLSNRLLYVDTVTHMMKRLRDMHGVVLLYEGTSLWLINTNPAPVASVQIAFDAAVRLTSADCAVEHKGAISHVKELRARALVKCESDAPLRFDGPRCFGLHGKRRFQRNFANATLQVNLSETDWQCSPNTNLAPRTFVLTAPSSGTGLARLSVLPVIEEVSLLCGQLWIVAREMMFKGRSLNSNKYLDDSKEIKLENHDHW